MEARIIPQKLFFINKKPLMIGHNKSVFGFMYKADVDFVCDRLNNYTVSSIFYPENVAPHQFHISLKKIHPSYQTYITSMEMHEYKSEIIEHGISIRIIEQIKDDIDINSIRLISPIAIDPVFEEGYDAFFLERMFIRED